MKKIFLALLFIVTIGGLLTANEKKNTTLTNYSGYFNFQKSSGPILKYNNLDNSKSNDLTSRIKRFKRVRTLGIVLGSVSWAIAAVGPVIAFFTGLGMAGIVLGVIVIVIGGVMFLSGISLMTIGIILTAFFKKETAGFMQNHSTENEITTGFTFRLNKLQLR